MPDNERVAEELEALQAILMDEIIIKRDEKGTAVGVETEVHPWTGTDVEARLVRLTLEVTLPPGYPDVSPKVIFRNVRGLSDATLSCMMSQCANICNENIGQPVIFELIQVVKEELTEANRVPSSVCCVCLYGFRESDAFTKTQCYHYFHSHCLGRALAACEKAWEEERAENNRSRTGNQQKSTMFRQQCPVCRTELKLNSSSLMGAPPPADVSDAPPTFTATTELRRLQESMSRLFLYQRSKGGIIQPDSSVLLLTTVEDESSGGSGNTR